VTILISFREKIEDINNIKVDYFLKAHNGAIWELMWELYLIKLTIKNAQAQSYTEYILW
jgi:hypothetical protein